MNLKAVTTLFDYHYGMFDRIWELATDLSTEQFVAESDYSLGSVRFHLVHCMNVDERWVARIRQQTPPAVLDPADFPDQASVRLKWDFIRAGVLEFVNEQTNNTLEGTVPVELADRFSAPRHFPRWQILLHMVNHGTDHRAQILARLHELGADTIEQDLLLHLWTDDL